MTALNSFTSIALAALLIISILVGLVAWMSPINPQEAMFNWGLRLGSLVAFPASLIGLIYLHSRPESVPDFLAKLDKPRIGRGSVLFVFDCAARNGWAWINVHYQNRFSNPANVTVALLPSQNFMMKRHDIEPVLFTFVCGAAAYGVIRIPVALKQEYQGNSQQFDVFATYDYPNGPGECLRNVVGVGEISKVSFSYTQSAAFSLAKMAITGGIGGVKAQSRVKVELPRNVADAANMAPDLIQEELWTLADKEVDEEFHTPIASGQQ